MTFVADDHPEARTEYLQAVASYVADYVEAGNALTPGERLEAARMLRLSVDQDVNSDSTEAASAWLGEVGSRVDDIAAGRVALVDAEETYRMISSELQARE